MGWRVLANILGEEFVADALPVCGARGAAAVEGFAGLPTLHQPNGLAQYLVVNSRPVRDSCLPAQSAPRRPLAQRRHPMLALFLTLPPHEVDVNVHPAKTELRFRDAQTPLIVTALRDALGTAQHRATDTLSQEALAPHDATVCWLGATSTIFPSLRLRQAGVSATCAYRHAERCYSCRNRRGQRRHLSAWRRAGASARHVHHRRDGKFACHRRSARGP